ncbi:MAG TPA: HDOD domain-containing protein [Verrucomicrobiae bacterium]|nr:HDOD domain-containing protein [Verrucomicrobiae bacterium]
MPAVTDLFIARQPILDRGQELFAYELLFRSGPENFFNHPDRDVASRKLISDSMLVFGLDNLLGRHRGFINASRKVVLDGSLSLLPNRQAVIELLETVEGDPEVLAACRALKEQGYLIALDDYRPRPEMEALVDLADFIKVDFAEVKGDARKELVDSHRRRGIQMLAEKVETREDFEQAFDAGYEYFQGYFFARPAVVTGKDLPALKINYLRLLNEINRPEVTYDGLEAIVKQDVALSVKLLRYLNSAAFGWRAKIKSIRHALTLLGERPIRKWVSLVALTSLAGDKPAELIVTSLMRARFCELLAPHIRMEDRELDLFLVGLLSAVDALVDRPLAEVVKGMALSAEVRSALTGTDSPLRDPLDLALSYERGDWPEMMRLTSRFDLDEDTVPGIYRESVAWSDALRTV